MKMLWIVCLVSQGSSADLVMFSSERLVLGLPQPLPPNRLRLWGVHLYRSTFIGVLLNRIAFLWAGVTGLSPMTISWFA